MKSTLIRFISSRHADSYRTGNLHLSSLCSFWDYTDGKISYDDLVSGKITKENIDFTIEQSSKQQMDISEGVLAQIRKDYISSFFGTMGEHIIHDVRFRLSAYKYCNLLCFTRIDAEEGDYGYLDEENAALVLQKNGKTITATQLNTMSPYDAIRMIKSVIPVNHSLPPNKTHLVQLPAPLMDGFGDMVVVIKDESEFKKRILAAVKKMGGHCIMGDVRYHKLVDRVDSDTEHQNCVTVISSSPEITIDLENKAWITQDGMFDVSLFEAYHPYDILWRGCLDKYYSFAWQKEWRICWLPEVRNYEAKTLPVGSLEDIVDLVKKEDIRTYLLERYKGYLPGIVNGRREDFLGTEDYKTFNDYMKSIDGLGDFIMEIG